jgi:putative MATE family efflux protein
MSRPAAARASHREIAALSIPAMAALAADPLLSLVDTALVGRLGAVPLGALGVNVAVFTTVFWVFNFLTYGTTAEVARLRGAGDPQAAARYALQALWLAVALGLLVLGLLQALAPFMLDAMGATGELRPDAIAYLRVRALAAVPVLIVAVGHGAFRGLKDTRTPLWVALAANGVNAVASWALIYPVGLGMVGAAWGTLLAQTGAAVAFLLLARRRLPTPRLRIDPPAMRRIAAISRDLFLRTAALQVGLLIATAAATRLGTTTVAAHQIARELWTMLALVLDGFAIAGQALVATALGAGRPEVARRTRVASPSTASPAGRSSGSATSRWPARSRGCSRPTRRSSPRCAASGCSSPSSNPSAAWRSSSTASSWARGTSASCSGRPPLRRCSASSRWRSSPPCSAPVCSGSGGGWSRSCSSASSRRCGGCAAAAGPKSGPARSRDGWDTQNGYGAVHGRGAVRRLHGGRLLR